MLEFNCFIQEELEVIQEYFKIGRAFYDTSAGTNGMRVSETGTYSNESTINRSVYATYTASSSFTPTPMLFMMAQSGGLI